MQYFINTSIASTVIFCVPITGGTVVFLISEDGAVSKRTSCSNAVPTTCQQDVFALLAPSLLSSTNLLPSCNSTICQQVVSDNLVAT
jgi:hypothetical protein